MTETDTMQAQQSLTSGHIVGLVVISLISLVVGLLSLFATMMSVMGAATTDSWWALPVFAFIASGPFLTFGGVLAAWIAALGFKRGVLAMKLASWPTTIYVLGMVAFLVIAFLQETSGA